MEEGTSAWLSGTLFSASCFVFSLSLRKQWMRRTEDQELPAQVRSTNLFTVSLALGKLLQPLDGSTSYSSYWWQFNFAHPKITGYFVGSILQSYKPFPGCLLFRKSALLFIFFLPCVEQRHIGNTSESLLILPSTFSMGTPLAPAGLVLLLHLPFGSSRLQTERWSWTFGLTSKISCTFWDADFQSFFRAELLGAVGLFRTCRSLILFTEGISGKTVITAYAACPQMPALKAPFG